MTDNTKEDPRVLTQEECEALVDGLSLGKREVLQSLVAACYYQLGVVQLEMAEPAPAHEFSWETGQRGERRQGKLDSISSVLLAAEQVLRELG